VLGRATRWRGSSRWRAWRSARCAPAFEIVAGSGPEGANRRGHLARRDRLGARPRALVDASRSDTPADRADAITSLGAIDDPLTSRRIAYDSP
jgi:hypothetical protein